MIEQINVLKQNRRFLIWLFNILLFVAIGLISYYAITKKQYPGQATRVDQDEQTESIDDKPERTAVNNYPKKEQDKTPTIVQFPTVQFMDSKPAAGIGSLPNDSFTNITNLLVKFLPINSVSAQSNNTTVLFMRKDPKSKMDIWGYSIPLAVEKKIIETDDQDAYPRFSPDSVKVLFESGKNFGLYDTLEKKVLIPNNPYRVENYLSGPVVWSPNGRFVADRRYLYDVKYDLFYRITQPSVSNTNGLISTVEGLGYPGGADAISFSADSSKIYASYAGKKSETYFPQFIVEYDIYTGNFKIAVVADENYQIMSLSATMNTLIYTESPKPNKTTSTGLRLMEYDLKNGQKTSLVDFKNDLGFKSIYAYLLDEKNVLKIVHGTLPSATPQSSLLDYNLYKIENNKPVILKESIGPSSRLVGWLDSSKLLYIYDSFDYSGITEESKRFSIRVLDTQDSKETILVNGVSVDADR